LSVYSAALGKILRNACVGDSARICLVAPAQEVSECSRENCDQRVDESRFGERFCRSKKLRDGEEKVRSEY